MKSFKRFLIFLAENKALGSYFTNLEQVFKYSEIHRIKETFDLILSIKPEMYLEESFSWYGTTEGLDYWIDLSMRWKTVVCEENLL